MSILTTTYCGSVFVIDPKKHKILLMYHKKFQNWVQPGGHLEPGETPAEAAIRQVQEETGIKIKLVYNKPFMIEKYDNFVGNIIDYQYVGIPIEDDQELINSKESYAVDWFTLNELNRIPIFPDVKTKAKIFLTPGFKFEE